MNSKRLIRLALLALAVIGLGGRRVKAAKESMTLTLINATEESLDVYLGTDTAAHLLEQKGLEPGQEATFLLTDLPLGPYTAIVAEISSRDRMAVFRRHLIYDLDAVEGPYKGLIVDYGKGVIDVKMVRK